VAAMVTPTPSFPHTPRAACACVTQTVGMLLQGLPAEELYVRCCQRYQPHASVTSSAQDASTLQRALWMCLLQLCLSFYEPRRRPVNVGWFGKQDERLYWERW
jgi:hypothetical protein